MNNDELKMLKNGRRFLFVGGALDGKWAFVDKKLDNYRKLKEARTASMAADSFFDIHKDLRREARINQVLDK